MGKRFVPREYSLDEFLRMPEAPIRRKKVDWLEVAKAIINQCLTVKEIIQIAKNFAVDNNVKIYYSEVTAFLRRFDGKLIPLGTTEVRVFVLKRAAPDGINRYCLITEDVYRAYIETVGEKFEERSATPS